MEENVSIQNETNTEKSRRESFFNGLNHHLATDKMLLDSNMASKATEDFYKPIIAGDLETVLKNTQKSINILNCRDLIELFLDLSEKVKDDIKNVSFDISGNKVLVWSVIKNNVDFDKIERTLIVIEAKINATFYEKGYQIDVTFVEEEDNIPTPPHYFEY